MPQLASNHCSVGVDGSTLDVDIQNKAIKELQAIQSAEEKAEQRVLTQCHVDVLRECETPRFVPPPFLFVGEDVPSPFADAFLGTSFRHPLAEVRQSSFLIISSSEPSMGLDRDDRQEQTQELQLFASSAPQQQDPVMQMARRRLSEATSQIPRGVPSHCLHTAFTEQRVSLRCAGALHHLQSVSTQKAESMIDLYRESTGDMQSLIAIYSLVCFCMLLVILGRRTRRKLSHRRRGPLLPCCTKLVIAVAYLLTTLSLALAISPVLMVLLVMVPVAALQFYFFHTCHDHCDSAYEQTRDSSESVCRSIDEVSSKLAVGNELVIYEGVPIQVV